MNDLEAKGNVIKLINRETINLKNYSLDICEIPYLHGDCSFKAMLISLACSMGSDIDTQSVLSLIEKNGGEKFKVKNAPREIAYFTAYTLGKFVDSIPGKKSEIYEITDRICNIEFSNSDVDIEGYITRERKKYGRTKKVSYADLVNILMVSYKYPCVVGVDWEKWYKFENEDKYIKKAFKIHAVTVNGVDSEGNYHILDPYDGSSHRSGHPFGKQKYLVSPEKMNDCFVEVPVLQIKDDGYRDRISGVFNE